MLISLFLIWVELALFEGPSFIHLLNHPGLKQQSRAAPFELAYLTMQGPKYFWH